MRFLRSSYSEFGLRLILAACVLGLGGCTTDPFAPLADAILGKDRAKPQQTGSSSTPKASAQIAPEAVCRRTQIVSSTDVDTAYAKAMRIFKFRTLQHRKHDAQLSLGFIDEGFRHDVSPGAYYHLSDLVRVIGPGGAPYSTWMSMELSREGVSKTLVASEYCVDRRDPNVNNKSLYSHVDKLIRDTMR